MAPHSLLESASELAFTEPYQAVADALTNTSVDITPPTGLKREDGVDDKELGSGGGDGSFAMGTEVVAKKRKKKGKSKSKVNKASGFEENYADAPLTPAEYAEEMESLYSPSRPFAERIETCIQRYRAKRRFDSKRKDIFDKYLRLGGIDVGAKMFSGGPDPKELSDMDAQDIARMTATDFVAYEISNPDAQESQYVVDFEGIAKGFFSSIFPNSFNISNQDEVKNGTNIVRNFLNYVLHHNVCPEYNEQVYAARTICDRAERELSKVVTLSQKLPGDFNVACSTLFGGYYYGLYSPDQTWFRDLDHAIGMPDARAKKILTTALAGLGTDEQCELASSTGLCTGSIESVGFEVTQVLKADEETRLFFESHLQGEVKCLGILKGVEWRNPTWLEEDLSDDEGSQDQEPPQEWTFWVEEDLLENIAVGMKIECMARRLSGGIMYFDTVTSVHCSFYTYLDNERMRSYKEPVMYPEGEVQGDAEAEHEVNEVDPEAEAEE